MLEFPLATLLGDEDNDVPTVGAPMKGGSEIRLFSRLNQDLKNKGLHDSRTDLEENGMD